MGTVYFDKISRTGSVYFDKIWGMSTLIRYNFVYFNMIYLVVKKTFVKFDKI